MGPISPSAASHGNSWRRIDGRAAYYAPPHAPSGLALGCCAQHARGAGALEMAVKAPSPAIWVDVRDGRSWPHQAGACAGAGTGAVLDRASYMAATSDWCAWCQMHPRPVPTPLTMRPYPAAHEAPMLGLSASMPVHVGIGGAGAGLAHAGTAPGVGAFMVASSWPGINHSAASIPSMGVPVEPYPPAARASMAAQEGGVYGHARPPPAPEPRTTRAGAVRFRGPPRKPRRSGYALWVGNLPHAVHILQLRDYFAAGAAAELESVFFMSRSNCAFVNYRSATAAVEAADRFRNANFHGALLTCRVRNSPAVEASSPSPTGSLTPPLSSSPSPPHATDMFRPPVIVSSKPVLERDPTPPPRPRPDHDARAAHGAHAGALPDRFFILKSLTSGDLAWSVRNGLWATQPHNEKRLHDAFKTGANVYLIFSINKSGHFYGFARMLSPIAERWREIEETSAPDVRVTHTPATAVAPAGRIVDDPVRGTLYWEIIPDAEDAPPAPGPDDGDAGRRSRSRRRRSRSTDAARAPASGAGPGPGPEAEADQDQGKPFEVAWLCTTPLPFIKTRGLQNSFNANKEVKVARDGTEVEPSVGHRLLRLFDGYGGPSSNGMDFGPHRVLQSLPSCR